jgi:hypothetical protein
LELHKGDTDSQSPQIPPFSLRLILTNVQYYKFTGVAKYTLVESLYIGLAIENSVGGTVAFQEASVPNQTVVLNWTCVSTGTYYLVVYEATATQNGTTYYEITCMQSSGVEDWSLY